MDTLKPDICIAVKADECGKYDKNINNANYKTVRSLKLVHNKGQNVKGIYGRHSNLNVVETLKHLNFEHTLQTVQHINYLLQI